MRFGLMVAVAFTIIGCGLGGYPEGRHYFTGAGLYTCPPRPTDEITQEQAERIQSEGGTYYIGEYGSDGRLIALENRLHREVFFRRSIEWTPDGVPTCKVTKHIEP